MANEYKGLTIKFEGDSVGLVAALGKIKSASRDSNLQVKQLQAALKVATNIDSSKVDLLNQRVKAQEKACESSRAKVDALKQAQQDLAASGDTASAAYQRLCQDLAVAETYLARDRQALVKFTEAATPMGQMSARMKEWSEEAKEAGERTKELGQKISEFGVGMTMAVTVPMATAAAASVKAAVDIDTAWYGVRKTVDGTEEDYQRLKDSAIELSRTQPISAETILNMEELGGQLGIVNENTVDVVSELENFAMIAGGLDIATNLSAEEAAEQLAQFRNITQMSNAELSNFASALVDLGNHSAATEADILNMATRMASAGDAAGMSEADILGLAAALASTGMNAEAGGSAVSTTIKNISNACANYEKALEGTMHGTKSQMENTVWLMEGLAEVTGMTVDEFRQAWAEDATDAFSLFLTKVGEVGDAGGNVNAVLTDLGINEIRQSDAMRRLSGNTELLTGSIDRSNTAWEQNSALTNEVNSRNESLASKFEVLKNRLVAVAEDIGKPVADALLDAADAAEPLFEKIEDVAKGFSNMSKEEQTSALKTAAWVAAAGPMVAVAGKAVDGFGSLQKGAAKVADKLSKGADKLNTFKTAAMATNPELIEGYRQSDNLAAKLGLVANKARTAAENGGGFKAAVKSLADSAASAADGGLQKIGTAFKNIGPWALAGVAVAGITAVVAQMIEADRHAKKVADAQDQLKTAVEGAISKVDGETESLEGLGHVAGMTKDEMEELWDGHVQLANSIKDTNLQAEQQSSALYKAWREIQEYANRTNLGTEDQQRLKDAVDQVNESCGTQYSVVDAANGKIADQNGVIQENTDAIKANIDQRLKQIKMDQFESQVSAITEQQTKDIEAYTKARQAYLDARQKFIDNQVGTEEQKKDSLAAWEGWGEGKKFIDDMNEAADALHSTSEALNIAEENFKAAQEAAEGLAQGYEAAVYAMGDLTTACTVSGVSIKDMSNMLQDCGANTEQLAKLTPKQMSELVTAYGQGTGAVVAKLQEFGVECQSEGLAAAHAWRRGLSDGAGAAVEAARDVSGMTLEQFKEAVDKYGIEGDTAVQAFAGAIQEGGSEAEAAAAALTGSTLSGIRAKAQDFAVCGQEGMDAYVQALADGQPEPVARNKAKEAVSGLHQDGQAAACGNSFMRAYLEALNNGSTKEEAQKKALEAVDGLKNGTEYATPEGKAFIDAYIEAIGEGKTFEEAAEEAQKAVDGLSTAEDGAGKEGTKTQVAFAKSMSADNGSIRRAMEAIGAQIDMQSDVVGDSGERTGTMVMTSMGDAIVDNTGTVTSATDQLADLVGKKLDEIVADSGSSGSEAVTGLAASIDGGKGEVSTAADKVYKEAMGKMAPLPAAMQTTGSKGTTGLSNALTSGKPGVGNSAQGLYDTINGKLNPLPGALQTTGSKGAGGLSTGMNNGRPGVSTSAQSLYDATMGKLVPLPGAAQSKGSSSASGLASGMNANKWLVANAGTGLYNAANNPVSGLPNTYGTEGTGASRRFAGGLDAYSWMARANAQTMAAQAALMKAGNTWQWGSDMSANFARGISAGVGAAMRAAKEVASAVAGILHHTTPDEGPMVDDDVWGLHFIENFSDGMAAGIPELRRAAYAAAEAASFEPVAYRQAWAYDAGRSHVSGSPTVAANTGDTINQQFTINANDPSLVASVVAARERQARR